MKFCFRTPLKYSEKYAIIVLTSVPDPSGCSVYVSSAHKYQEMLRVQLNISAGVFFVSPERSHSVFLPAFFCPAGKTAFKFSAGVFYVLSENCFLNSFSAFFVKINRKNSNGAEN